MTGVNGCVYIHELIEIIGHNRNRYMQHMTANWVPVAIAERAQRCLGVWATVGSTGHWPEVVNIWELAGWDGLAANFAHELAGGRTQDPALAEWWAVAATLRRGGTDRILVPAPWSPSSHDHEARGGSGATVYLHEIIGLPDGGAAGLLDLLHDEVERGVAEAGASVVGAFRTAMRLDDEIVLIWGLADWDAWARFEQAWLADRSPLADWRDELRARGAVLQRSALVDAPLSPLRIGRQPAVTDRVPLDEIR